MAKFFRIPWAVQGDRESPPDAVQADGSLGYNQGFPFDYERANTDPDYKPVPREGMNGILYDITDALGTIQQQGVFDWITTEQNDGAPLAYRLNALVRHSDRVWRSRITGNTSEPGTGDSWADMSITHNVQRFTASGSFTVPDGITVVYLSGCAGGGGGGGGAATDVIEAAGACGGGGGAGEFVIDEPFEVTPGQLINVQIGAAGTGGFSAPPGGDEATGGGNGGNTAFGTLVVLKGGDGGGPGLKSSTAAGGGGVGGAGFPAGGSGTDGTFAVENAAWTGVSGAGASGPFGGAGSSLRSRIPPGDSPPSAGISATGFGAGGGGGNSAYKKIIQGGTGGSGAPGYLKIEW